MNPWTTKDIDIATLDLISTFALLYSVMKLKNVIKKTTFGFPNTKLVMMHWICELTWSILFVANAIIIRFDNDEEAEGVHPHKDDPSDNYEIKKLKITFAAHIIYICMETSFFLLNFFLMYLISKFIKGDKPIMTKDPILGRDVPNFVFL